MNFDRLSTAVLTLFAIAICCTLVLLMMIRMQVSPGWQEAVSVSSLMLGITSIAFSGFLLVGVDMRVHEIYAKRYRGFFALMIFNLAAILAAVFWEDWLVMVSLVATSL